MTYARILRKDFHLICALDDVIAVSRVSNARSRFMNTTTLSFLLALHKCASRRPAHAIRPFLGALPRSGRPAWPCWIISMWTRPCAAGCARMCRQTTACLPACPCCWGPALPNAVRFPCCCAGPTIRPPLCSSRWSLGKGAVSPLHLQWHACRCLLPLYHCPLASAPCAAAWSPLLRSFVGLDAHICRRKGQDWQTSFCFL